MQNVREAKAERIERLVQKRKSDRMEGFYSLADFHCGYYECDFVVPWTISACNLNAALMLVAQDWASEEFLCKVPDSKQKELGQDCSLPTNVRLKKYLREFMNTDFSETYATDAFVFIKPGKMTARIPSRALIKSVIEYTLPQISIVRPKMVLCLGSSTFNAVRRALRLCRLTLADSCRVEEPPHTEYEGIPIFGMAHTGGEGHRAVGGDSVVEPRWKAMGAHLKRLMES